MTKETVKVTVKGHNSLRQRIATKTLTIGVIQGEQIKTFIVDNLKQRLSESEIFDAQIKRKIAGASVALIRDHGVRLNSWDSIEFDVEVLPDDKFSVDVYFLIEGQVKQSLLGFLFDSTTSKATFFDVIAIQPKRKYQSL